jgi:hypothetical protein
VDQSTEESIHRALLRGVPVFSIDLKLDVIVTSQTPSVQAIQSLQDARAANSANLPQVRRIGIAGGCHSRIKPGDENEPVALST